MEPHSDDDGFVDASADEHGNEGGSDTGAGAAGMEQAVGALLAQFFTAAAAAQRNRHRPSRSQRSAEKAEREASPVLGAELD